MYCKNCGKEIDDHAYVCLNCGALVNEEQQKSKQKSNGMAIAGFVCSFFLPVLGLVFGGIGCKWANERNDKGRGLALAAIWISIAAALIIIIVGAASRMYFWRVVIAIIFPPLMGTGIL